MEDSSILITPETMPVVEISGTVPTTSSATSDIPTNTPQPHQQRRRRSLSMAEPQPNVETVIVKAKRAAQSLWMLLHAQVRRLKHLYMDVILRCLYDHQSHIFLSCIITDTISPSPPP